VPNQARSPEHDSSGRLANKDTLLKDLEVLRARYRDHGGANPVILQRMEYMQNELLKAGVGGNDFPHQYGYNDGPQPGPGPFPPIQPMANPYAPMQTGHLNEYAAPFNPYTISVGVGALGGYKTNAMYSTAYGVPPAGNFQQQLLQVILHTFIIVRRFLSLNFLLWHFPHCS